MTPTSKQLSTLRFAAEMELARLEERMLHYIETGSADMAAMHASDLTSMHRAKDSLYTSLSFYPFHEEEKGHSMQPLPEDHATAQLVYATAQLEIAGLRLEVARLEALAMLDPLTGIANRRMFDTELAAAFSRSNRTQRPLTVVVIDLDNFKRRNDTFGHAEGDRCLKALALSLSSHLRLSDTAARIGGEEFALILPDTDQYQALELCDRVSKSVRECCGIEPLTFSAGVAEKDATMAAGCTIVDYADKAMYEAKRAGKNRAHTHKQAFKRSVFRKG